MKFVATDSQRMIAETVRRMMAEHNEFDVRRRRLSGSVPDRMALWRYFADAGILGALLPERAGGFGGTTRDVAVILYELGRSLTVEPYLATLATSRILQEIDDSGLAEPEIQALIEGARVVALAHIEGFDPFATPKMAAVPDGGGYLLTGSKPVVRHADVADAFIVTACLPGQSSPSCFLVEGGTSGLTIESLRLIDASGGATLSLDRVPGRLIATGSRAAVAVTDALEWVVVGLAAEAVGIMDALNEKTRDYLRTRVQFGLPIAKFQALQHRIADMYIAGEEASHSVDELLDAMDGPMSAKRSARVSALKLVIDRAGRKIGHEAVQLHGGMGVSDELDISHYMKRLAAIRVEAGGEQVHRDRFRALAA